MVEHRPWVGDGYEAGLDGQRTAIVGYSHWKEAGKADHDDMTTDIVSRVVSGDYAEIRFFSDIIGYFGHADPAAFWRQVVFFNFVPDVIGDEADRYMRATREQNQRGAARALRLYAQHRVEKAFVFTAAGWSCHPTTREEATGRGPRLGDTGFGWGHFDTDGWTTVAVGLRHPQYAPGERMRKAVALGRELPVAG